MGKKKFRAELYKAYIDLGLHDHALVQEYIKVAESFVFDKKEFTQDDQKVLIERLSGSSG